MSREKDKLASPLYQTFPALDGVRAISILWVIFYHLPVSIPSWLTPLRNRGELGVELFFSISGFLVTRSLFQCIDKSRAGERIPLLKTAKDFILRRVARIFPPYFLLLAFLLLIARFIDTSLLSKLAGIREDFWMFPVFLSNYLVPISAHPVPDTLGITWSLAFEEQFYLILLFMFLTVGSFSGIGFRRRLAAVIFGAGLASIAMRLYLSFGRLESPVTIKEMQMFLHLRFDALSWACLSWFFFDRLGWLWKNPIRAFWVNVCLVFGIVLTVAGHHWFPESGPWQAFVYCLTGPIFTIAVRALCETRYRESWIARLLSHPISATIGMISYEIYLIHEIVIGTLVRAGLKSSPFLYGILAVVISLGAAWLFHRCFSVPTQKWIRQKGGGSSQSVRAYA